MAVDNIPASITEAAELAEQLHEKMFSTSAEGPSKEDSLEEVEEDVEEETEEDEEEIEEEIEEEVDDVEDLKKYKARYQSLKGKYDAEVPRLHKEIQEFKETVFERLGNFQKEVTKEPEKPTPEQEKLSKFKEEYGDDFVEALKELIKTETDPFVKENLKAVETKVASVEETQIKVAQENFKNYLDDQVKGDWRVLWEKPPQKFLDFLTKADPSGLYTYGDLVQHYNDSWDADKLSKVFNIYFEESTSTKPTKVKEVVSKEKEALIAPSKTNTHTSPDTEDKRIWTQDMIEEFQRLDRQKKYSPEESKAMWDDLLAAVSENRIK